MLIRLRDTAGQERYKSLAPMYYRNANCAVVVYDITQSVCIYYLNFLINILLTHYQASLTRAKAWVKELQRQANENIIIALAGNKLDLADTREVPTEEAAAYAKEAGLLFFETSAKSGENVTELFTAIAQKLPIETAINSRTGRSSAKGIDLRSGGENSSSCQC